MTTATGPRTLDAHRAFPARTVARAEAPLTAGTERYMEAAAQALALACLDELRAARGRVPGARVLLLVGGGHNGGDALLAGALLAARGCRVTALLATDRPHAAAFARARTAGVETWQASTVGQAEPAAPAASRPDPDAPDLVLDGLTGTGAGGPLRPAAAALVRPLLAAGERGARPFRVLAVDLPSGTGVDDGTLPGPVLAADRTLTFTCPKPAHLLPPAAQRVGRLEVIDLGLPLPNGEPAVHRPADARLAALLRVPGDDDHKYTRGVVALLAGSETYPGAAVLATTAAVRAGAGMVRILAPRRVADLVLAARPEAVPAAGRSQCLVLGPGTAPGEEHEAARTDEVRDALRRALAEAAPAVIDAGALLLLPEALTDGRRCGRVHVLTPHAGEAASLLTALGEESARDAVDAAPASAARRLARLTGATVLLKGAPTLVAPADGGPLLSLDAGPGWLATAGSGDVLAGALGALLASARADEENGRGGLDVAALAALAVRLHATAGAIAAARAAAVRDDGADGASGAVPAGSGAPVAALDVAEALPAAWHALRASSRATSCADPDGAA